METIKKETSQEERNITENSIEKVERFKNNATKNFINNKGFFVGLILMFIVIVVYTTNVTFNSEFSLVNFGLSSFILLFCSYSMYINCADSGIRAGRNNKLYNDTNDKYNSTKNKIIQSKKQIRLPEFCKHYIYNELINIRENILTEVGITYKTYKDNYLGKDKATINSDTNLSKIQKKTIIYANKINPIDLSANMIMQKARSNNKRKPLGESPKTKRERAYIIKFIITTITALFTVLIVLDAITNPSWETFAELCLKLLLIVFNGFTGYKMGYENITIDTVNYMNDQIDLMEQFEQYCEENPEEKKQEIAQKVEEKILEI